MIIRFHGALVLSVSITIMGYVPEGATVGFFMIIPFFRLLASATETDLGNRISVHPVIALTRPQIQNLFDSSALLFFPQGRAPYTCCYRFFSPALSNLSI